MLKINLNITNCPNLQLRRWYSISGKITDIVIWYHKLWWSVNST